SDRDATVRENRAYLETLMNDIIRSVQQHDPSVVRTGEVLYRTIAGHASVTFVIAYGTTSLVQKIAVVVSEAHGRYWAFILTVFAEYYETANVTVEGMLDRKSTRLNSSHEWISYAVFRLQQKPLRSLTNP